MYISMVIRGFIRGDDRDLPQLITFQQNCRDGALLATVSQSVLCVCEVIVSGCRHG